MTITSAGLIARLRVTERLVRRLDECGDYIEKITADEALKVVARGGFLGVVRGANGQVRSIRPIATVKPKPIEDAFPGRPVVWTIGYSRSVGGRVCA